MLQVLSIAMFSNKNRQEIVILLVDIVAVARVDNLLQAVSWFVFEF